MSEQKINTQLRKAQGETNERLAALLEEQRKTNYLLEKLLGTWASAV